MRLDEAEKTVRQLVDFAAADPKIESIVLNRHDPAPVFREGVSRLKSFVAQFGGKELGQLVSKSLGIRPSPVLIVGRKSLGTETNTGLHDCDPRRRFRGKAVA